MSDENPTVDIEAIVEKAISKLKLDERFDKVNENFKAIKAETKEALTGIDKNFNKVNDTLTQHSEKINAVIKKTEVAIPKVPEPKEPESVAPGFSFTLFG